MKKKLNQYYWHRKNRNSILLFSDIQTQFLQIHRSISNCTHSNKFFMTQQWKPSKRVSDWVELPWIWKCWYAFSFFFHTFPTYFHVAIFISLYFSNKIQTKSTLSIWKSLFYSMAKESSMVFMISVLINATNHHRSV